MFDAICKLLRGLSNVDGGAESLLNSDAKDAVIDLIRNVYGDNAADTVGDFFDTNDHQLYFCYDEVEDAFRICLQGRGR